MGGDCFLNCPEGWDDTIDQCFKPMSYVKPKKSWINTGSLDCQSGYHTVGNLCAATCPESMIDNGVSCTKRVIARPPSILGCDPVLEAYDSGLCYPPCKYNTRGSGPVCWGRCPNGTETCAGVLCL